MAAMPSERGDGSSSPCVPRTVPLPPCSGEAASGDTGTASDMPPSSDDMKTSGPPHGTRQQFLDWWSSGGDLVTLQWTYLICAPLLCLFLLYGRQKIEGMGGNDLTYTFLLLAAFVLYPRGGDKKAAPKPGTSHSSTVAVAVTAGQDLEQGVSRPAPASPPARLYYLDNMKSFMTLVVVMHHILIGYGGPGGVNGFVMGNFKNAFSSDVAMFILVIDQSYFMCMFFFISGYFTPSSLLRKGVREFFHDKFMRLGLPFFVFFFGLNCFTVWFAQCVVMGQEFPVNYWPVGPGPPWFLKTLLLFNIFFVVVMGTEQMPTVRCPSVKVLMGLGLVFGLVQSFFKRIDLSMFGIPQAGGLGSMPFDVLFFCGGCLAKKNKWLETFEEAMRERRTLWTLRVTALVVIALWAVEVSLLDVGPFHLVAWWPDGIKLDENSPSQVLKSLLKSIFFGLMTTTISMNLIQLFSVYGNFSNKTSQFFSEAAYGVYILHAAVWPLVSYTYVLLLRASDVPVSFSPAIDGQIVSSDDIGTWRVVLGFLYTFFLSNLILWPLAFFLRKLPGLRKVL